MKVFNFIFILISFSVFVFSDKELISAKLENILPADAVIESIEPSIFDGIYKVYYGDLQPIYVSQDGNFFIYGDMYQINSNRIINITNEETKSRRVDLLSSIPSNELQNPRCPFSFPFQDFRQLVRQFGNRKGQNNLAKAYEIGQTTKTISKNRKQPAGNIN